MNVLSCFNHNSPKRETIQVSTNGWRLNKLYWTARRSNQSILKEINPGISLEEMMLKLKLQYFGHLMRRVDSLEKTLMLGRIWARRRRGHRGWDGWMASPTWWTWVWVNPGSWWWTGRPGMLCFIGLQRVRPNWATELYWTEMIKHSDSIFLYVTKMITMISLATVYHQTKMLK